MKWHARSIKICRQYYVRRNSWHPRTAELQSGEVLQNTRPGPTETPPGSARASAESCTWDRTSWELTGCVASCWKGAEGVLVPSWTWINNAVTVDKASHVLSCVRNAASRSGKAVILLYFVLVRPYLDCDTQLVWFSPSHHSPLCYRRDAEERGSGRGPTAHSMRGVIDVMGFVQSCKGKSMGQPRGSLSSEGQLQRWRRWICGGSGRQSNKGQQPQIAAGEGCSGGEEKWP